MKCYLMDASYFSNMLDYYPMDNKDFNFIWEKLKEKVKKGEVIFIEKAINELREINNNLVEEFLHEIKPFCNNKSKNDLKKILRL